MKEGRGAAADIGRGGSDGFLTDVMLVEEALRPGGGGYDMMNRCLATIRSQVELGRNVPDLHRARNCVWTPLSRRDQRTLTATERILAAENKMMAERVELESRLVRVLEDSIISRLHKRISIFHLRIQRRGQRERAYQDTSCFLDDYTLTALVK